MSKPEWNEDTPKWANWLAQDWSGVWYWYEKKPISHKIRWAASSGKYELARDRYHGQNEKCWQKTLEPHP